MFANLIISLATTKHLWLDRYASSRYQYVLQADIFADAEKDIFAPKYRLTIMIIADIWQIIDILADILADIQEC